MAYSTNPYLVKARATALQLLIRDGLPVSVVARRCGIHRTTLWRWKRKWDELNKHIEFTNYNRPNRKLSLANKLVSCSWQIPTRSSRPHTSPGAISDELVALVLEVRQTLRRCAEVVWHHLATVLEVSVSLSSVRRILRRNHCFDGARKNRIRPDNPRRPKPTYPGELVQTDTIHHVDPTSGRRMYIYTVIDLYTRMTHAVVATKCLPGLGAQAVLSAQRAWGFSIAMVQADNGPEYSRYFEQVLRSKGVAVRHSRLQRPNDNAHIERFNRTIQTECVGYYWRRSVPLHRLQKSINEYLDFYNTKRVHLGIQLRTPAEMLQRS